MSKKKRPPRLPKPTPAPTRKEGPLETAEERKRIFIAAYAKQGTVGHASIASGIPRRTHYEWLKFDPSYAVTFADACELRADILEKEADRRAVEGWLEPSFYQGKVCGAVKKYSDSLLVMRLKSEKPEKYRDRVDQHVSGQVTIAPPNLSALTDEELAQYRALAAKVSAAPTT